MITKVNMICIAALCLLFTANNSVEAQVPGYVPTDGLVGYWGFNGNANDESGNGNDGTVNGATPTEDRFGNANSAYDFDGADDYIVVPHNDMFDVGLGSFTWSVWCNPSQEDYGHLITKNSLTVSPYSSLGRYLRIYENEWAEFSESSSVPEYQNNVLLSDGLPSGWINVVAVKTGEEQLSIYFNGVLNNSTDLDYPLQDYDNNSVYYFGVDHPSLDLPSGIQWLEGQLDDIAIYNRALTEVEIMAMYQGQILGCTDVMACNYNADATEDDGSCEYVSNPVVDLTEGDWFWTLQDDCDGLAIPFQLGFNADQTINDLQVNYWDFWTLCDSSLLITSGVTNEQVPAQWNGEAFVYLYEDGDCLTVYEGQFGCTDSTACNYNDSANTDDNSCIYVEGICDTCSGETDGTGVVVDNDADDDGVCDDDEIVGCQDPDACNYDPLATDEGECYYMPVYSIEGSLFTSAFDLEFYTYTNSEGSTYAWTCTGCAIQTGNGTSSVGLVWGEEGINELCVQETDSTGCVGELICVDVAVTATNVEDIDGDHFTIYPNPASTSITISTDAKLLNSPYRITDAQGKLVMEGTLNSTTVLNTDQLSNGQYTLTIISEETVITKPLIIQK